MSNKQFEEVESLLQKSPKKSRECPTCGGRAEEAAPGIYEWPKTVYKNANDEVVVCDCAEQVELFRHYLLAHIPEEYMRLGEEQYYGDQEAWDEVTKYLSLWEDMKAYGLGLGLYSKTQGTGKTFLATRVARELVKAGETVYYINFRDIMALYEMPYEERANEEDRIKNSTLLILDEVVGTISAAQKSLFGSKFEEVVRYRTNYGRVTILTTNLKPADLDANYERTYSLLAAKERHIGIAGHDARREGIWDYNQTLAEYGQRSPIL